MSDTRSHTTTAHGLVDRLTVDDDGAHEAFLLLRTVFVLAPILFGLDKFFEVMTNWDKYLAPWINDIIPGSSHQAMLLIGVIEIVAGILVAVQPKIGAWVVAAWLVGIMVDLLSIGGYGDVALRDFGLFVAALALARLAVSPAAARRSVTATVPTQR